MSRIDIRSRKQIEAWLGRALTPEECIPVASLAELSDAELQVVRILASRQLVICISYLLAIVASPSVREILLFTHKL